jgi:hypothetical protein
MRAFEAQKQNLKKKSCDLSIDQNAYVDCEIVYI